MHTMLRSAIPPGFSSRKSKILANLSLPDAGYTDLSPKGSVDEGIRDLIRDINAIDGLVTTSSCAGRVSVFVEGRKKRRRTSKKPKEEDIVSLATSEYSGADETDSQRVDANQDPEGGREFAVSGGKGDGHWLYVSHDPVNLKELDKTSFHELFGLLPGDGKPAMRTADESGSGICLVRFHFEPMILHVMTATLRHAQPVLSAASSAGFRESGLQSLRCLDFTTSLSDQSPASDTAAAAAATSPIVAVRSSGLSLESIIGYCEDSPGAPPPDDQNPSMLIRSLVTEEYLQMLVALANERFTANTERVERFRQRLLELTSATSSSSSASTSTGRKKPPDWEHPQTRRERMRAEGMRRKEEAALMEETSRMQEDDGDTQMGLDF